MAETTTISNLPQITIDELTNDTLVPVENVDGTKAANLAQLRKKLNSLYVEMVDADLNELKQDGIYECLGTTLNAPTSEVAAWIIQTAEHDGVVVQNAFGLGETSYSYVYRRRWNGVSWTEWENKIQTLENVKANAVNTVTTDTAQTISGSKRFTQPSAGMSIELVADTNQQTVPATTTLRQLGLYKNNTNTKGDGYTSWVQGYRGSDGWTTTELCAQRFLEGDSQKILNYIKVAITSDGTPISYTKTPPIFVSGEEIVTASWFNTKVGGFANTNASNFTATGKQKIVGWSMPDYSAGISVSGNGFTASANGVWYVLANNNSAFHSYIVVNGTTTSCGISGTSGYQDQSAITIYLSKGDVVGWSRNPSSIISSTFYPLKGNK